MNALASVVTDESGPYRPSDDEPFMNERQQAYFKKKLLDWKDDILRESKGTVVNLKAETENHPDLVDRASSESDRALELRTRDRQRKLISKIDDALRRIEEIELRAERDRLAELHAADLAQQRGREDRSQPRHAPRRGALGARRQPYRPRLPGRAAGRGRNALLHQLRRAALRAA